MKRKDTFVTNRQVAFKL